MRSQCIRPAFDAARDRVISGEISRRRKTAGLATRAGGQTSTTRLRGARAARASSARWRRGAHGCILAGGSMEPRYLRGLNEVDGRDSL